MNIPSLCDIEDSNRRWKTIVIDGKMYSVRAVERDGIWKVFLTNLRDIWIESLDQKEILEKCKRLNPNLDTEDIDVVQFVNRLLDNVEKNSVKKTTERIEFAEELEGGIFKFSIDFTRGNSQQLWEEVTMPLCLVAGELQRRQTILLDVVRKKDEEITEYKLNGAELTRKYIKTEPFHVNLFEKNAPKLNSENSLNAFENAMKSHGDIEFEKSCVKTESTTASSTEENDDVEKSTKIKGAIESEMNNDDLVVKNQIDDSSIILPKIERIDLPKIAKKWKNLESERDKEKIAKRARSAPSLTAKRTKKGIHDFIT